ncbi:MAG: type II secretion system F family protein [Bacilli bacterium]|nr:type II secretion system F family protein [Bacilli bacterium]
MNKIFSQKHLDRINHKLLQLGVIDNRALAYLTVKLVICVIISFLIAIINVYGIIAAPFVFIILYFLIDYLVIDLGIKKRRCQLEKDSIIFFKILYFNYRSSKNLKVALKVATNNVNNDLSKEFKRALDETEVGKSLYNALKDLEKRIPSNKLNMAISNLNESMVLGSDVTELLENQIKFFSLSVKNYQAQKISRVPIKIAIIFMVIIVPIIYLVLTFKP